MTPTRKALIATGAAGALAVALLTAHVLESHDSKDGKYRVELADYGKEFRYELWSTDRATNVRKKIGKQTPNAEDVVNGFVLSSDSRFAAYSQRNSALGTDRKLYSTPIYAAGSSTPISQPMLAGAGVENLRPWWDGNFIRYTANVTGGLVFRDYVVGFEGGRIWEFIFTDGFESGNTNAWSGVVK